MEWVEITARTVEEARELALDQLGVDEQDAEIEVLEEPRAGLFGRLRGQARVRARVKPTQARPKVERRDRRRKREDRPRADRPGGRDDPKPTVAARAAERPAASTAGGDGGVDEAGGPATGRRRRGRGGGGGDGPRHDEQRNEETGMSELTIDQQAEVVEGFLTGLAAAFGVEGTSTTTERVEEDTVEIRLDGGDLGLLIGPKGQTLQLVQELARTVVQRRGGGTQEGRIRIDVAGYRRRRREALERFTQQVAADVVASGVQKALEPMNPADRKVVHDTVNGIDGVRTISEGEEPRRRVVLLPAE